MTETLPSANDIIFGSGAKSAEWPVVGAWVGGKILTTPKSYHAKEYTPGQPGAGKPKYTQAGNAVMGVKVDVQTNQRENAEDTGSRRMHLDKWRQIEAVRAALVEADAVEEGLEPGGELWVQWSGETTDGNTAQPAKTWVARYRKPSRGVQVPPASPAAAQPHESRGAHTPAYTVPPGATSAPHGGPAGPQDPPGWPTTPSAPVQPAYAPPAAAQPTSPPVAMPAPAPAAPPVATPHAAAPGGNVLTASVAASLQSMGVDTSGFTIVPD